MHDISRSNQTLKFGHEKSHPKCARDTSPRPFSKKSKYLDISGSIV